MGLHESTPAPTLKTFASEWSGTGASNVEKKPPECCNCWNCDLLIEVAAEIDLMLHSVFLKKPGAPVIANNGTRIPSFDCSAPGFEESPGTVVLLGGDHGAGACPCHLKLNFSLPEERKSRGELNCRCPMIQIASIDCAKDSFELLGNTVMPKIKEQLGQLQNSSAFVVCSCKQSVKHRKAYLLPKGGA